MRCIAGQYDMVKFYLVVFSVLLSASLVNAADPIYSWTDEQGITHYGAKVPAGQKGEKLSGSLSRYNSQEMIKRLKEDTAAAKAKKVEEAKEKNATKYEATPKDGRNDTKVRASSDVDLNSDHISLDDEERILAALEKLEASGINIKFTEGFEITNCSARIKNVGNKKQDGIAVVFDFKDGSRVVGDGPVSLGPGEDAKYSIPADLLPFSLNHAFVKKNLSGTGINKAFVREQLTPKIIIGIE